MQDKAYKVNLVQNREPWTGKFGTFNSFAIQLDGVDGWVEISQKQETPAPTIGSELFGHLETSKSKDGTKTFYKFKKASKQGGFSNSNGYPNLEKDMQYAIMMLEECTNRRESPANPVPRAVTELMEANNPTVDDNYDKPIDLATIPF